MGHEEGPWREYAAAFVELLLDGRLFMLEPRERAASLTASRTGAGTEVAAFETLPVQPVWIITAWNPHPHFLSREENERRGRSLEEELDAAGLIHCPAVGRSPDWSAFEHSRAVIGSDRTTVLRFAAAFDQLAVFEITDHITCVAVDGEAMTSMPYRLTVRDGDTGWR
jgi:hypothetical protein